MPSITDISGVMLRATQAGKAGSAGGAILGGLSEGFNIGQENQRRNAGLELDEQEFAFKQALVEQAKEQEDNNRQIFGQEINSTLKLLLDNGAIDEQKAQRIQFERQRMDSQQMADVVDELDIELEKHATRTTDIDFVKKGMKDLSLPDQRRAAKILLRMQTPGVDTEPLVDDFMQLGSASEVRAATKEADRVADRPGKLADAAERQEKAMSGSFKLKQKKNLGDVDIKKADITAPGYAMGRGRQIGDADVSAIDWWIELATWYLEVAEDSEEIVSDGDIEDEALRLMYKYGSWKK